MSSTRCVSSVLTAARSAMLKANAMVRTSAIRKDVFKFKRYSTCSAAVQETFSGLFYFYKVPINTVNNFIVFDQIPCTK